MLMSQSRKVGEETNGAYLDREWLLLIMEAKNLGLSFEEVNNFLRFASTSK
ncbi:anti-repressor SinI family protein [Ectobacillus polymachus]|uniref:anti-repressor SinI family protein n=1 Tax=Ectobacillus polymachus TaxID=1508806 RepID=UPI003A86BA82